MSRLPRGGVLGHRGYDCSSHGVGYGAVHGSFRNVAREGPRLRLGGPALERSDFLLSAGSRGAVADIRPRSRHLLKRYLLELVVAVVAVVVSVVMVVVAAAAAAVVTVGPAAARYSASTGGMECKGAGGWSRVGRGAVCGPLVSRTSASRAFFSFVVARWKRCRWRDWTFIMPLRSRSTIYGVVVSGRVVE